MTRKNTGESRKISERNSYSPYFDTTETTQVLSLYTPRSISTRTISYRPLHATSITRISFENQHIMHQIRPYITVAGIDVHTTAVLKIQWTEYVGIVGNFVVVGIRPSQLFMAIAADELHYFIRIYKWYQQRNKS